MLLWVSEDGSCLGGVSMAVPISFMVVVGAQFSHLPINQCISESALISLLNALLLSALISCTLPLSPSVSDEDANFLVRSASSADQGS